MDNLLLEFSPEDVGTLIDVDSEAIWLTLLKDQILRDSILERVAERYAELAQQIDDDGEDETDDIHNCGDIPNRPLSLLDDGEGNYDEQDN